MAALRTAKTRIIRTPAAGPQPCNTLVFLRCLVLGMDAPIIDDGISRNTVQFQTEFRLDGYLQSQFEWYKANTLVSAAASLRFLNTTTDVRFIAAVDSVEPELQQLDGSLEFRCGLAGYLQDDTFFSGGNELVLSASLTAYVLCYEPRAERPPSGSQRTPWAKQVEQGPKLSGLSTKSQRRAAALRDVSLSRAAKSDCRSEP